MKYFLIVVCTLVLCSCGVVNDKYNGLIVVDGNGKKYVLKHNLGDNYFINEVEQGSNNKYVVEANSNLKKE